jgi:hypothetical protein
MRSVPHCEQIRDQQQVLEAVVEYDRVPEPFGIREFHRPRDIGQVADDLPVDLPPLWTNLDGAISLDRYAETVPHKPRDGPPTWRRGGGALLPARFARPLHSGGAGSGSNRWTESPTRSASCTRNSAMTVSFSFMTC